MTESSGISRRRMLAGTAGLAGIGIGAVAAGVGTAAIAGSGDPAPTVHGGDTVPFYGEHQAGITTPEQAHANFVGLDLQPGVDAAGLAGILAVWTDEASRTTQGNPGLADTEPPLARTPSRLTVTVGLGPGAFDKIGLAERKPAWLTPLPAFSVDRLEERWGQTDLVLQICADNPTTVAHTTRVLLASIRSRVELRWIQRGFVDARGAAEEGSTMRNLMGQLDGTVNPDPQIRPDLLWDDGAEQPWLAGGTSMVIRRIAMNLDTWGELERPAQELVMGRKLDSGAPLTGEHEHDVPDFTAMHNGITVIPENSHIARAHQRSDVEQFLRRSYNYDEPPAAGEWTQDAGLVFVTFQRDITTQFVPVQARLAEADALNTWTTPIGSAVYAVLPGAQPDRPLGATLLDRR